MLTALLWQWTESQTAWHYDKTHESIQNFGNQFIPGLMIENGRSDESNTLIESENQIRVLVPLCGKTLDMAFLASRNAVAEVVGVDGVQQALDEFAQENPQLNVRKVDDSSTTTTDGAATTDSTNADATTTTTTTTEEAAKSKYEQWKGDKITLLQGDFFHLDEQATGGKFDAIFDRGSLVAISPDLREAYVQILSGLLKPGGRILTVAVYRCSGTDEDKSGPPYSVSEDDMSALYGSLEWVESVTLLEKDGEKERNADGTRPAMFYLIQAKSQVMDDCHDFMDS
jgi:thiopurine S-methyltransferase